MKVDGRQLVAELTGCNKALLNDEKRLTVLLTAGIIESGLTQVHMSSHKFQPIGVTLIAIISESHVALHTFPESGHASLDVYHCNADSAPLYRLLKFLQSALGADNATHLEISRGAALNLQQ